MTNSLKITGLVLTNIVSRFLSACLFYKNLAHLTSTHKRVGIATGIEEPYVKKEKVKFTLEQATKPQRGSRGIALLFL
jgi:succinate dehydrogenase hydrophobic anchor subunit